MGELDEVFMLGAVADDEEGAVGGEAGFDSEIDALPGDLATGDDERRGGIDRCPRDDFRGLFRDRFRDDFGSWAG